MKKSVHCFIDKARKAGSFETSRQGTNFGWRPEDLNEAGEDRAGLFDEDYKTFEVYADVRETDSAQSITRDMGR